MPNRYRRIYRPTHPFAEANGQIKVHRLVLMEKVGMGSQTCHWCGKDLEWIKGGRGGKAVIPDHIDGDGMNNDPSNLVPSCQSCNTFRVDRPRRTGPLVADNEPFITHNGFRERAIKVLCAYCGQPFLTPPYRLAHGRGKFCSRSHASLHTRAAERTG